jgi:hypothetical protein
MRLYFHLTNGRDRISDERGVEVIDVEAARREALEALEELEELHQDLGIDPCEWAGWQLEVTTASGALVFRICLGLQ